MAIEKTFNVRVACQYERRTNLFTDIDECFEESHDCQHKCNNTDGGFTCDCFTGYTLNADNKTCNGSEQFQNVYNDILRLNCI